MAKLAARKKAKDSPDLDDFERWTKSLRRAFLKAAEKAEARLKDTKARPRKRALNVLKLLAYRYYRDLKAAGLLDALRQHIEDRDGSQWTGHGRGQEAWVLRLATRSKQTASSRQIRSRLAAELRLADINDVRPDLLLGFLYEAGPIDLIKEDLEKGTPYAWAKAYR
jgi:hypothetical protein